MRRPEAFRKVVSLVGSLLILTIVRAGAVAQSTEAVDLSGDYGFQDLEIFKLEQRSHSLQPGDFNHDGRTDLVLVDNSHSRLDLLLQRAAPPEPSQPASPAQVNDISSHWRFEHVKIPVDYGVAALMTGDFNHDGRTDLAYFGEPDRLVILFQKASGEWTEKQVIRLADVEPQPWCVASGDFNGDERDDLVVLGKRVTYLLLQSPAGRLSPPEIIRNTAEKVGLAVARDLDGDGRDDLFYLADDADKRKACCRLQNPDGRLGPEIRFEIEAARGITLSDVLEGAGAEVLNIDGNTGRVRVSQFSREADEDPVSRSRLVQYGFGESSDSKGRDLATGDLNGDGLDDVVVTDPESAQVIVFLQHPDRGLDLGTAYPSFLGVGQVRLHDVDQDGRAEVFVLSSKEKIIGICRYAEDRLTFPVTLPIGVEPVAFELVDTDGDGEQEVVYLGKAGRSDLSLRTVRWSDTLEWAEDVEPRPLKLANEPSHMRVIDANRDERPDLLLTSSVGRDPSLLMMNEQGEYTPVETPGGLQLGAIQHGSVFTGNLEGPVTLVAQKSFARNMLLGDDHRWQVLDQYNPAEANAKIEGVATLDLDGAPGHELVLIDTGVNKLRMLRREGEQYLAWKEVELGSFSYLGAAVADLNGDEREDLLLFGPQRFAVLYVEHQLPRLREVASFESKRDDVFFFDLVAGDINDDQASDIVVLDMRNHSVEIITMHDDSLTQALSFKVFEEKSFGRRGRGGTEPRESLIVDVTSDGLADLVLLCHDRVLVYPQDPGADAGSQAGKPAGQVEVEAGAAVAP